MDKQTVVEELMAQRDAVIFGDWVRGTPTMPNQACLIIRNEGFDSTKNHHKVKMLSHAAQGLVQEEVHRKYDDVNAVYCNDHVFESFEDAVEILDGALIAAKELENKEAPPLSGSSDGAR